MGTSQRWHNIGFFHLFICHQTHHLSIKRTVGGIICCDPRSGIDKYSPTNERKNRVKNTRWRSHRVFFTRFFLEFGVNIWNSAERSSAYCHYSSFFGHHNQQWWIRANIQQFFQYCGAKKRGIMCIIRQRNVEGSDENKSEILRSENTQKKSETTANDDDWHSRNNLRSERRRRKYGKFKWMRAS